jgi:hypothetical protein
MLEAVGSGTIYPGELVYMTTATQVHTHETAGAAALPFFAVEHPTPDTSGSYGGSAAIDIPYSDGDTVYFRQALPGDEVNARLANGQSVIKGLEWLISDGNGELASCGTGISVGTSNPVGVAWQTVTASGITRGLVRIR